MARLKLIKAKSRCCVVCARAFIGQIDPTGSYCSKSCSEAALSLKTAIPPLSQTKTVAKPSIYPFVCKNCGRKISKGNRTKAHRKGKCSKNCRVIKTKEQKQQSRIDSKNSRAKFIEKILLKEKERIDPKFIAESLVKKKLYGSSFYTSPEWLRLRYIALAKYDKKCHLCSANNTKLHVDHIKPRSKYPELALEITNLQILCEACNLGKGAWDETDWRPKS